MPVYGSVDEVASTRKDRRFHREAILSVLVISSVTLIAAGYAAIHAGQHSGSAINLLEVTPINVPVITASQLARLEEYWNDRDGVLEAEKRQIGTVLANDMRQAWSAESQGAEIHDLRKVELLRNRYDSIISALKSAPVLSKFRGPNGELRGFDPSSGNVYQLYEYHVPGDYEDAELDLHPGLAQDEKTMGEPFKAPAERNPTYQGEYPEYAAKRKMQVLYEPHAAGDYEDAELDLHPGLAEDEKTMGEPFKAPADRSPTYQGEYPEYAAKRKTQSLYEPHAAGDYEDAELDLHPGLAEDEKHMGEPFEAPADRNPTYQGEYPEYAAKRKAQALYEYHVPGDYEDAELDLHPGLAEDEKHMGEPFKAPAERNPTYQARPPPPSPAPSPAPSPSPPS